MENFSYFVFFVLVLLANDAEVVGIFDKDSTTLQPFLILAAPHESLSFVGRLGRTKDFYE